MNQHNKKRRIEEDMSIIDVDDLMEKQWYQLKYIVVKPFAEPDMDWFLEGVEEVIDYGVRTFSTYVRLTKDQFLLLDRHKPTPHTEVWKQMEEETYLPFQNELCLVGKAKTPVKKCILVQSIELEGKAKTGDAWIPEEKKMKKEKEENTIPWLQAAQRKHNDAWIPEEKKMKKEQEENTIPWLQGAQRKHNDAWIPEEKMMKNEKDENTRPWRQWAQRKHNVAFKRKWKWTDQLQNHISWWQKGTRIRNKSEEPLVNWKDSKVFKDTEQKEQSSDEALVDNVD